MNFFLRDHKTGFKISNKICHDVNSFANQNIQKRTFYHFWNLNNDSDRYICFIRNPYEIIVSGFLYHKKCKEKWAINCKSNYYEWWRDNHFLDSQKLINKNILDNSFFCIDGKTYQETLNSLNQDDGILFEMKNISKLTIDGMCKFDFFERENVLTIKMEDLISNYHSQIITILKFLDIEVEPALLEKLEQHNLKVAGVNSHVTNKKLKKNRYLDFFNDNLFKDFIRLHEKNINTIERLGYNIHY